MHPIIGTWYSYLVDNNKNNLFDVAATIRGMMLLFQLLLAFIAPILGLNDVATTNSASSESTSRTDASRPGVNLRLYSAVHPHELSSSLLHAQCVIPTFHHQDEEIELKELCCESIIDRFTTIIISKMQHHDATSKEHFVGKDTIDFINNIPTVASCRNHIISSLFDFNHFGHDLNVSTPSTSYVVYSWVHSESSLANTSTSILSPLPYRIYKPSLFYDSDGNESHTSIQSKQAKSVVFVHVDMVTELSVFGGMHRTIDHTISVQPPSYPQLASVRLSKNVNITLNMIYQLPSNLFINVEDCFQHGTNNIWHDNDDTFQAQLQSLNIVPPLHPEVLNIDQEEPEFMSPAHIVLVQIKLRLRNIEKAGSNLSTTTPAKIHFSTKLHIRYPKPFTMLETSLDDDGTASSTFRHLLMAPPVLTSAVTDDHRQNIVVILQNQETFLQLWIAAGHQSHFVFTILTTIAVAIVGSFIMLYDLSTIADWC